MTLYENKPVVLWQILQQIYRCPLQFPDPAPPLKIKLNQVNWEIRSPPGNSLGGKNKGWAIPEHKNLNLLKTIQGWIDLWIFYMLTSSPGEEQREESNDISIQLGHKVKPGGQIGRFCTYMDTWPPGSPLCLLFNSPRMVNTWQVILPIIHALSFQVIKQHLNCSSPEKSTWLTLSISPQSSKVAFLYNTFPNILWQWVSSLFRSECKSAWPHCWVQCHQP